MNAVGRCCDYGVQRSPAMLYQAKREASSLLASLYRRQGDAFVAIAMFKEAISTYQTGLTYELTVELLAVICFE